jgi:hypothetical protein
MWEVWRCPHCKNYYEEIAINEHKEVCDGFTTTEKDLPEGGVQERTTGSDSVKGTT